MTPWRPPGARTPLPRASMSPSPRPLDDGQVKDAGMALVLLLLLGSRMAAAPPALAWGAIAALVLLMTWTAPFRPWARFWFGLTEVLGAISSKVVLTLIFLLVATPVAVIRRWRGADAMRLKALRAGTDSVFVARRHTYTRQDLERPF